MNLTDTETESAVVKHGEVDHDNFRDGKWDDEPDLVKWIDDSTSLVCVAVRHSMGHLCGYVQVPADHDWHERKYDDLTEPTRDGHSDYRLRICSKITVHGGVTYSARLGKHIDGVSDEIWFFGFDCFHAWDVSPKYRMNEDVGSDREYRDIDFVIDECRNLARQIDEWEVE